MKVGNLVTFKLDTTAIGVVVSIEKADTGVEAFADVFVSWNFIDGAIGRQKNHELRIISESR